MTNGLCISENGHDWYDSSCNEVDIQYGMVVQDALRAASKSYFDPRKKIKVNVKLFMQVSGSKLLLFLSITLQVCFVGESVVDTGGPSREFWHLFATGIEVSHFRSGKEGCFF